VPCPGGVGQELLLPSHFTAGKARAGAALCLGRLFLLVVVLFLEGEPTRWLRGTVPPRRQCTPPRRSRLSAELSRTAVCKCDGEMHCCLLLLEALPATSMAWRVTHCSTAARKTGAWAPTRSAKRPLRSCRSTRLTGKSSPAREEREQRLFLGFASLPSEGPPEPVSSVSISCSGTVQTSSAPDMPLAALSGVSAPRLSVPACPGPPCWPCPVAPVAGLGLPELIPAGPAKPCLRPTLLWPSPSEAGLRLRLSPARTGALWSWAAGAHALLGWCGPIGKDLLCDLTALLVTSSALALPRVDELREQLCFAAPLPFSVAEAFPALGPGRIRHKAVRSPLLCLPLPVPALRQLCLQPLPLPFSPNPHGCSWGEDFLPFTLPHVVGSQSHRLPRHGSSWVLSVKAYQYRRVISMGLLQPSW